MPERRNLSDLRDYDPLGERETMEGTDLPGYAAGTLTTLAFWPQLQKTSFTKSAGNVLFGMLFIFSTGVVLWLGYGIVVHSWPIILTNVVTLGLAVAIGTLKLRYHT